LGSSGCAGALMNGFRGTGVVRVPPQPDPGVDGTEDAADDHDRDEYVEKRFP